MSLVAESCGRDVLVRARGGHTKNLTCHPPWRWGQGARPGPPRGPLPHALRRSAGAACAGLWPASGAPALLEAPGGTRARPRGEPRQARPAAVTANQQAVDLAPLLYPAGPPACLSLLEAHRALYTAADALGHSSQTTAPNLITLYKALGGGWERAAS
jgi:hypothetical protein